MFVFLNSGQDDVTELSLSKATKRLELVGGTEGSDENVEDLLAQGKTSIEKSEFRNWTCARMHLLTCYIDVSCRRLTIIQLEP